MLACKRDGSWWGCGVNGHGQLALGTASLGKVLLPQRLPFSFEPWAFATSLNGTTALLARDGTLWTWGVRAGEPYVLPLWDRLAVWWKSLWSHGHPVSVSYSPDWVHDKQPHFVWELPASVKAGLGTNAPSASGRGP
jgi:alpha-tubulin suppressor-like RCC1 family protein